MAMLNENAGRMLQIPKKLLESYKPDPDALLKALSDVVDDSMLNEIACADYDCEVGEHLSALLSIRDKQNVPVPLTWCPREVLELVRWSEPENPDWRPGSMGRRGHVMRAFCCAALLRAAADSESRPYLIGENQTIAQLLVSLRELPPIFSEAAVRLFAYRLLEFDEEDEERPFFILALLLLVLKSERSQCVSSIAELATWLLGDEQRIRTSKWVMLPETHYKGLLGLTYYDLRHDVWIFHGEDLSILADRIADDEVRGSVKDIASRLSG